MQLALDMHHERMRATKHAPRGSLRVLERRHGLAEIVERRIIRVQLWLFSLRLEELYASSAQAKRPRCEHESRTADVTVRPLRAVD